MRFIAIWLGITIIVLGLFSFAMYDRGNPETGWYAILGSIIGLMVSSGIMGIVWWVRTVRAGEITALKTVIFIALLLPLVLIFGEVIRSHLDSRRWDRIRRYQVHTLVMTIETEGYSEEQLYYFRPDGFFGIDNNLIRLARIPLENERELRHFENLFNVVLPEIDFRRYYFFVLPGQEYAGWGISLLQTRDVDLNTINIYQVNVVR